MKRQKYGKEKKNVPMKWIEVAKIDLKQEEKK